MDTTEVLVIGGGINGVSIAFHLANRGAQVTLVEKSSIAGGPSGLSSAIIRQHYSNPVTARMALESLRVWQNFSDLTGSEQVFNHTGFLLGVRPEDVEGLKRNIAMQQSVGINTRFVSPEELTGLEPNLDVTGLGGAAYEPDSGYANPVEAANGFAQAAVRLGSKIRIAEMALDFDIQKDKVAGLKTDQGFISAGSVVIAAGPWSPILLEKVGLDLPMFTARVKVVFYRRPDDFDRHRIWGDFITQIYLRPETGNLMLVGSISPEEETGDRVLNPDEFNEKVELDVQSSFAERAAMRYPAMQRSHVTSSFASLYDITPDWHHVIDSVPGIEGLYICAGGSGHGFKLAPAVGEMMARLVLDGKRPQDDVNLFSWDRFESGDLVRGQYEYSILG